MPRSARRYGSSARNGDVSPDDVGQLAERRRRRHNAVGHRQRPAELVHAAEMEVVRGHRLAPDRGPQHVGRDERIAVAVTADPRTHADDPAGVDRDVPSLAGELLDRPLDLGHDLEQAGRVVAQRLVDLVDDAQLRQARPRPSPTA